MIDIGISFCGVKFKNPVVVAASPATENIDQIARIAQAGPGAIILKSVAQHTLPESKVGFRRALVDSRGLWATSTFERESLPIERGIKLVVESTSRFQLPIIASVASTSLDAAHWLPICNALTDAGASMLQLDLFYMPQPVAVEATFNSLLALLSQIRKSIRIPVIAKLNIEFPAYLVAAKLNQDHVCGLSLLDSVRVPSPDGDGNSRRAYQYASSLGMSSLFGPWQFPLTLHYVFILSRLSRLPLCAGGGIETPADAILLLRYGATCIQVATPVLLKGQEFVKELIVEIKKEAEVSGYKSISELIGSASLKCRTDIESGRSEFQSATAAVTVEQCTHCGDCATWTFCTAISFSGGKPALNANVCEGCGFCVDMCKHGARYIQALNVSDLGGKR